MAPLTRSAARLLRTSQEATDDGSAHDFDCLSLRRPVAQKADAVWASRGGVDAYTDASRSGTAAPQVDHCIECQMYEHALARAFAAQRAEVGSIATTAALDFLRTSVNGTCNLNVTSSAVNQAKRGPFSAAMRRMAEDRLRDVTVEQLARQGRARWLVDSGAWARIEREVVRSYDAALDDLSGADVFPSARALLDETLDETRELLCRMRVM